MTAQAGEFAGQPAGRDVDTDGDPGEVAELEVEPDLSAVADLEADPELADLTVDDEEMSLDIEDSADMS
ncbi:MAG: hypothetical protein ACRDNZ_15935, partial [Streptosporangiaceae bacterium]